MCPLLATSITTTLLPSQCSSYTLDTDTTRSVNYTATFACDSSAFGNGTWVRFASSAGTQIPTTVPSKYSCGTHAPGWYNGTYPPSAGSTNTGNVCYSWGNNTCNWSNSIRVTNCLTYFVFFLTNSPTCTLGYCVEWFDLLENKWVVWISETRHGSIWSVRRRDSSSLLLVNWVDFLRWSCFKSVRFRTNWGSETLKILIVYSCTSTLDRRQQAETTRQQFISVFDGRVPVSSVSRLVCAQLTFIGSSFSWKDVFESVSSNDPFRMTLSITGN